MKRSTEDNKGFWKTVKALSSDKSKYKRRITLIENIEITSGGLKVAQTRSDYFVNVVKNKL